jgi:hypothetical protein
MNLSDYLADAAKAQQAQVTPTPPPSCLDLDIACPVTANTTFVWWYSQTN